MKPSDPEVIHYSRDIALRPRVDVLVVGGGPAGIAAAVASARHGARTLLVEQYGCLGGNMTVGLVGPCMTSYSLDGATQLIKGIYEEVILAMEAAGGAIHPSKVSADSPYTSYISYGHDRVTPFEPEALKTAALDICRSAGVEILLHTSMIDTLLDDSRRRVTGVVVSSKSGVEAIPAAVVVDCSADADVIARAGGPTLFGRDGDHLAQPMTLFFRVSGVDDETVDSAIRQAGEDRPFLSLVEDARAAGEFSIPRRGIGLYKTLQPGVWRINTTRVQHTSGINADDLTSAEIIGRQQVSELMQFFHNHVPGFANAKLLDTAQTIGVRETRRILGDYTLTLEDLKAGTVFPDAIAFCGYPVDLHSPDGSGGRFGDDPTANVYSIPYRSLVPKTLDGALVAGRSVSATHEALGAIRVMPPAFAMGQAAGTAAALCIGRGVEPRQLDAAALREALVLDGVYLG